MYIQPHWNRVVQADYPPKARDYVRASEIGYALADRWLSMKGEPITNPYSDRTLRVFDAGKAIEHIVMRTLAMAGLLNKKQAWITFPAGRDHLRVVGRLDATIGGFKDWDHARRLAEENVGQYAAGLDDDLIKGKVDSIIAGLQKEYPDGWPEEMLVEVKSVSSMVFWNSKKNHDERGSFLGYPYHKLQLYAYLVGTGIRQGILLYVSKDDLALWELPVSINDEDVKNDLYTDLRTISGYYWRDEQPPLDDVLVYNDRMGTFEVNWNIKRSQYLTRLYGYTSEDALETSIHQELLDINRALRHMRTGKVKPEDWAVIERRQLTRYVQQPEPDSEDDDG